MDETVQSSLFIDYQYEEAVYIKLTRIHHVTWYIAHTSHML